MYFQVEQVYEFFGSLLTSRNQVPLPLVLGLSRAVGGITETVIVLCIRICRRNHRSACLPWYILGCMMGLNLLDKTLVYLGEYLLYIWLVGLRNSYALLALKTRTVLGIVLKGHCTRRGDEGGQVPYSTGFVDIFVCMLSQYNQFLVCRSQLVSGHVQLLTKQVLIGFLVVNGKFEWKRSVFGCVYVSWRVLPAHLKPHALTLQSLLLFQILNCRTQMTFEIARWLLCAHEREILRQIVLTFTGQTQLCLGSGVALSEIHVSDYRFGNVNSLWVRYNRH